MGRLGVLRGALRCALLLGAWCPAGASLAEDGITVYYNDRPPYLMLGKDGSVHGLTATPALQAFQAAGIATIWQRAPTNRQLVLLQEGGRRCAVGWFRNAARERFARFSKAIYRDLPPVALARADLPSPPRLRLGELLALYRSPRGPMWSVRFFFFSGTDCSCFAFIDGGGATGMGKPRKIITRKIGSSR
ncbi:hypothetical protein [Pseudoduganella namucuonensis]|uniref:Solute-binding protein family 3/N-terminal domain-containing protein n=1 Tax=Pseudoduganella namucuonensis TaxID=1035707 RepID=A0A1I7M602_9BURK|nr:hypothetical protein [Pseudoduganella namucuonensis]SFV17391.1 hypothetical protein SAMN05216552_106318 [Pseudoduganella namucuonensis]